MSPRASMLIAYSIVYTTFNLVVALVYNLYGFIVFKAKYNKLSHTSLSKHEKKYLSDIKFVNVHRNWLKKYYVNIRNYSILYFVASEIICFALIFFTAKYVLICRITLFVDLGLLLFLIYLIFYLRKHDKKLALEHKENLKKALKDYAELSDKEKKAKNEELTNKDEQENK